MSTSEGPITLVLNVLAQIPDPTAQWGNPARAVQIQNSSGFVVNVTAGGEVYTLQPFVAQTIPLPGDGQNVTILPTANPYALAAAGGVYAIFLLGTTEGAGVQLAGGGWVEAPPMDDGPLTAAAIAAAIEATVNVPLVSLVDLTLTALPISRNVVAPTNLGGLLIFLSTQLFQMQCQVLVQNLTKGFEVRFGLTIFPLPSIGATPIPVPASSGDTINLTITFISGTNNAVNANLLGLGFNPTLATLPGAPISNFQVGGLLRAQVAVAGGGGSSVILPAPPDPPFAYRCHRFLSSGAGQMVLLGTTTGQRYGAVEDVGDADSLDGQIVQEGLTALNFGAAGTAHLTYDLVSVPNVT